MGGGGSLCFVRSSAAASCISTTQGSASSYESFISSGLLPSSDKLTISSLDTVDVSSSDSLRILLGLDTSSSDSSSCDTVDTPSV